MRRINPIITFITIATFIVCFGTSIWFLSAASFRYNSADQVPILRSAVNQGTSTANFRRHVDGHSFQQVVTVFNIVDFTSNYTRIVLAYVSDDAIQSPWLVYGKLSIPTRADPSSFIA